MQPKPLSRTAVLVAAYRARATEAWPALCNDPWAAVLAGDEGDALSRAYDATFPHMELWIAVRTAWFDRLVHRTPELTQIVVLGAGLDARAARLAGKNRRFFEVDHPATQAAKRDRIAGAHGYPANAAVYVGCDFEHDDFVEQLRRASFDPRLPAMFLWEGVSYYLTEDAVRETLRRIADEVDPRSAVAFDYLRRSYVRGDVRDGKDLAPREFVTQLGEPLHFGTNDVLPLLYDCGYRSVHSLNFDEACLNLHGTYDRARTFRFQGLAVASRAGTVSW